MRSPRSLAIIAALSALLAAGACRRDSEVGSVTSRPDPPAPEAASESPGGLGGLADGDELHGFTARAKYLGASGRPMGARLVHDRTGFVFDLLRIQSVPQAFTWVGSWPTSDMGEPHTQEHLLLGKGNVGRAVASYEEMALASSSAFTQQERTVYHFHTIAGTDAFFELLERRLHALLHPDYTDEEIRREVRNFGVTDDPATGRLRLEEKGTVYNEMVRSFEQPWSNLWRALRRELYGEGHPAALVSGGLPSAIREMQPEHIRRFHEDHYHLANMGMVAALPDDVPLDELLERVDAILGRVRHDDDERRPVVAADDLPAPEPGEPGTVRFAEYPHENAERPGIVVHGWPPTRELEPSEDLLLELFVESFAADSTSTLYRHLVDSQSRVIDVGATSSFGWVGRDHGRPVFVGLADVDADELDQDGVTRIRDEVTGQLRRIAAWPAGSKDLERFNEGLRRRLVQSRRQLAKAVSSPPRFGYRGTGSFWLDHLEQLEEVPGFDKSLTLEPQLSAVESVLSSRENPWTQRLEAWGLLEVPVSGAAKASPQLLERLADERRERIASELVELKRRHGVDEEQAAIAALAEEQAVATERLEELARAADESASLVDDLPMTLDDQLRWERLEVGGLPIVASTFEIPAATFGLALDLDGVDQDELVLLAVLPTLLTEVGIADGERVIPYDVMKERLREEILSLSSYFATNERTGRVEIVVRGSGGDEREASVALRWMRDVLLHPDWRPENLARLRDVVDQRAVALRGVMQGREEAWVQGTARGWRRQDDPLFLSADNFLTRARHAMRLRFLLRGLDDERQAAALSSVLQRLARVPEQATRAELRELLDALDAAGTATAPAPPAGASPPPGLAASVSALPDAARELLREAAEDVEQLLPELPDASLVRDWSSLWQGVEADLSARPADVLARLNALRASLLRRGSARAFLVASESTRAALQEDLEALAATLEPGRAPAGRRDGRELVTQRLRDHAEVSGRPLFVGLVNPNTRGGVHVTSAPCASHETTDRERLLDFLASKLYSGGGAHGIFMKTWGAGLAYSNGLRSSLGDARMSYYAERCPELPQTMRFVVEQLEAAPRDPALVDYAVAQVFRSRAAAGYEERGEAMAADLEDGTTPEVVRAARERILKLRDEPRLADELFDRMLDVCGRVLPGLGPASRSVEGGVYYFIGPERQLELQEEYLRSVEGPDARLYRLHPRDYWIE